MSSSSSSNSSAFSFISKDWREVRDLVDVDIQLMRHRANSFKNLATDRFCDEAPVRSFDRRTLRSQLRIDLLVIRNAIMVEVEDGDGVVDFDRVRKRNVVSFREFWGEWKSEVEGGEAAQRRKKSFFSLSVALFGC
ncbi:digalactosyldiacylglycerol synthase 1 [Quercus suber]|uniref:Digalactosyldiacylglycerol synthase 1 n=1 Tax=Quercus suber TaxID=58331 RepID=A0AAW0LPZ2_QUESU